VPLYVIVSKMQSKTFTVLCSRWSLWYVWHFIC